MHLKDKERISRTGLDSPLPELVVFPNQFKGYTITLHVPEYTSVCPMTGQPDFGEITLGYIPNRDCVELKSFKFYVQAYRSLGIFYENAVNRMLRDFVAAVKPQWASIKGEFTPRGGIRSTIEAEFGKRKK